MSDFIQKFNFQDLKIQRVVRLILSKVKTSVFLILRRIPITLMFLVFVLIPVGSYFSMEILNIEKNVDSYIKSQNKAIELKGLMISVLKHSKEMVESSDDTEKKRRQNQIQQELGQLINSHRVLIAGDAGTGMLPSPPDILGYVFSPANQIDGKINEFIDYTTHMIVENLDEIDEHNIYYQKSMDILKGGFLLQMEGLISLWDGKIQGENKHLTSEYTFFIMFLFFTLIGFGFGLPIEAKISRTRERAQKRNENFYRELMEGLVQGILIHQDSKGVYANKSLTQMFGYEDQSRMLREQAPLGMLNRKDRELITGIEKDSVEENKIHEFKVFSPKGGELWISHVGRKIEWNGLSAVQSTFLDITEQKEAEGKLLSSETRFRMLVEGSLQGIVVHRDFKQLFVNQSLAEMFGYESSEEMLEMGDQYSLVAPHEKNRLQGYYEARTQGKSAPKLYDFQGIKKDGTTIWVTNLSSSILWEGEQAVLSSFMDITNRKLAEKELYTAEANFRNLLENDRRGIFIGPLTNPRFVNIAFAQLLGFSSLPEVFSYKKLENLLDPEKKAGLKNISIQGEGLKELPPHTIVKSERIDGSHVHLDLMFSWVEWEGEKLVYLSAADVSRRVHMEEALAESEQNLTLAQEIAHAGSSVRDLKTGETQWSDHLYRVMGLEPEEHTPSLELFFSIIHPDDRENVKKVVENSLKNNVSFKTECRFLWKTGEVRDILVTGKIEYNQKGEPQRLISVKQDITDMKNATRQLESSEKRLRTLIDTSLQGIVIIREGQVIFCNQALVEMFAFSSEQELMASADIGKAFHPQNDKEWERNFNDLKGKKLKSFQVQGEGLRKGGGKISYISSVTLAEWEGEPALFCILVDISENVKAQEALAESEQTLRLAQKVAQMGAWTRNLKTGALYWSDGVYRVFGLEPGSMEPDREAFLGFVHPTDRPMVERAVENAVINYQPYTLEHRIIWPDGTERYVREEGEVERDKDGNPERVIGVIRDITRRKLLDQERALLAEVTEQAGDSVIVTDRDGIIMFVNPGFTRLTGYTQEEAQGQTPRLLKSGKQPPEFYQKLWETLVSGNIWKGRYVNRAKDGTLIEVEATHSPVRNDAGEITHFVSAQRDITEFVLMEEKLRRSQRMEAIGNLAGGIAHDFNNLLMPIIGFTELALERHDKGTEDFEDLSEVHKAANRAKELVEQILLFSRKRESRRMPLQVSALIMETLSLVKATFSKNIEVIFTEDKKMPVVNADQLQMNQVLMNLCVNAGHAMPQGGKLEISLDLVTMDKADLFMNKEVTGDFIRISVSDTGEGINEADLKHIFEPFFTTKEVGKGTGLGLASVFGIVEQHKGHVNVESKVGEGTRFEIYLPVWEGETKNVVLQEFPQDIVGGSEKILLVDDEDSVGRVIKRTLEGLGYHVFCYTKSTIALDEFLKDPGSFDLVISDQTMPDLQGSDMAVSMRAFREDIPIILTTGFSETITPEQARELGFNAFMLKPIPTVELAALVRTVLDNPQEILINLS